MVAASARQQSATAGVASLVTGSASLWSQGMPHKYYHGTTGVVWNVTKRSVGVVINKQVQNWPLVKSPVDQFPWRH
jgi:ribosomal protein L21E